MDLNALSPYVRRAMYSELSGDFKIGQRIIFDYELIYLEQGSFLFTCDGITYTVRKGDFVFIRPGHPHTLQSLHGKSISQPHIHFDVCYDAYSDKVFISFKDRADLTSDEEKMIREDLFDIPPILRISDKELFTARFYELIEIFEKKPPMYMLLCKEKMLGLLTSILKDNTNVGITEKKNDSLPAMIKHYIDYNYQNPISLESLEKQFHYSRFYISRTFLAYTGKTVIRYASDKRLDHAKKLLRKGIPVSGIVEELHYGSIYAFSRHFKKETGMSPSAYKNR